ncbi:MAG: hypothetical protein FJ112_03540 [Deltaproteobacteria bacterium]|nr:hypothetical protein [Deltaproteobacteria bacterium]
MINLSFFKSRQSLGWVVIVFFVTLVSCVSSPKVAPMDSDTSPSLFKIRFQNMLGLEMYSAGCSMIADGGVERMCQYSLKNPADLVFQVGPSFSPTQIEPIPSTERQSKRNALWKSWEVQGVKFYSVDAFDLLPSLGEFLESHQGSPILLLSSNLKNEKGEYLFTPSLSFTIKEKRIGILSFSEVRDLDKKNKVENIATAFSEVTKQMSDKVDVFYILGTLSRASRDAMTPLTSKPILFIGGELKEQNSIDIEKQGTSFWIKAPDLGRGFGELTVGDFKKDWKGRAPQATIGGLPHSFRSSILKKGKVEFNSCSQILKTTKPQSLETEALEKK